MPYELQAESYTELLWFFEGMTSYYDDLLLVRSGLIDESQYLTLLAKTLTRVQRGSGRQLQSVTESSFDAWHKFYKQDENAPNSIVSYYAKGALIALCMDALMRQESSGTKNLDSLMRALWQRWLETGQGIGETEPQTLASTLVGKDLSAFFNDALYSSNELPVAQWLETLGIQLGWRTRLNSADTGNVAAEHARSDTPPGRAADDSKRETNPAADATRPWLGANFVDAPGGVRLVQVFNSGPAETAGLAAGDLIVAINSLSVSKAELEDHLVRHAQMTELAVHYFRLGQLFETRLPIVAAPLDTAELRIIDRTRMTAWLKDDADSAAGSNADVYASDDIASPANAHGRTPDDPQSTGAAAT